MRGRLLWVAYLGYLVTMALVVWRPRSPTRGGSEVDVDGVPAPFGPVVVEMIAEFALNMLMFVPLSLLGAFLLDRWRARWWLLVGLGVTVLIETVQGSVLPDRTPSVVDLVANTLGALVGLAAAHRVRHLLRRRRADRMTP